MAARLMASEMARRTSALSNGGRPVLTFRRTVLVELTCTVPTAASPLSCRRLSALGNIRSIWPDFSAAICADCSGM